MNRIRLAFATVLLASGAASAADNHSWKIGNDSFHIYYRDLDVSKESGRKEMLRRVERAARQLCDDRLQIEQEECVAATLAAASRGPAGEDLALALAERGKRRWAKK